MDLIQAYSKMRASDLQADKVNILCYLLNVARGGNGGVEEMAELFVVVIVF